MAPESEHFLLAIGTLGHLDITYTLDGDFLLRPLFYALLLPTTTF